MSAAFTDSLRRFRFHPLRRPPRVRCRAAPHIKTSAALERVRAQALSGDPEWCATEGLALSAAPRRGRSDSLTASGDVKTEDRA